MSQRLIKVLGEEEDLTAGAEADSKTPFIKQDFYREIFESGRGGMIKSYGVELSSDENSKKQSAYEDSEAEEALFLKQQRISSKVSVQIVEQEIIQRQRNDVPVATPFDERHKKGYWAFPKRNLEINSTDESYASEDMF